MATCSWWLLSSETPRRRCKESWWRFCRHTWCLKWCASWWCDRKVCTSSFSFFLDCSMIFSCSSEFFRHEIENLYRNPSLFKSTSMAPQKNQKKHLKPPYTYWYYPILHRKRGKTPLAVASEFHLRPGVTSTKPKRKGGPEEAPGLENGVRLKYDPKHPPVPHVASYAPSVLLKVLTWSVFGGYCGFWGQETILFLHRNYIGTKHQDRQSNFSGWSVGRLKDIKYQTLYCW